MGDDEAPTGLAPTQLGDVIETEANTAWSLDDDPDDYQDDRWWTPARITALAVAASAVVVGVAAVVAVAHLNQPVLGQVAWIRPDTSPTTKLIPVGPSGFDIPPPPVTHVPPDRPPLDVAELDRQLMQSLYGQGWVIFDEQEMAQAAHAVCAHLQTGRVTPQAAIERLRANEMNPGDSEVFVSTVMRIYPNCS